MQKGHGNTVTMYTTYSIKNSSIQGPNSVQTWTRNIYCRLAVTSQPQRRQRWTYPKHRHKGRCHTKCDRHPGVHAYIADSTDNRTGWTPSTSKKYYNYRLAKHKRSASHWHKTILVLQMWHIGKFRFSGFFRWLWCLLWIRSIWPTLYLWGHTISMTHPMEPVCVR